MAGALVGGAVLSAFLQVAFDRAASREVLDYLNGRKLIDRLVQKLKIELMSAGAVLNDAEEKQITDPAVKKWLDELKDAVYVADDLLDEIAYEALRCKLEAESTSTSKVMGFLSTFVNSFDKRIQSELENILEQLESITKQKDVLRLEKVAAAELPSRPLTTSCPEEYGVFGRDKDMEAIFEKFQSDDNASDDGICVVPIVEDLLQRYEGNGRMEEIGEQYFEDLVSRSFFQRSSSNQSCFVMHDLFNDLAIFISGEFCFKLENNESCVITRKTRHLSYVRTEYDASKKFKVSYKAKDLRTFLGLDLSSYRWHWNKISTMMIDDLLLTFKCLRVLSFSCYNNMRELPNSIGNFKHLRYLNLSYTPIKRLPDSLCNLYKLQTLLLSECYFLAELPTMMWRLVNLRHLDLVGTILKEMPSHMGKLINLVKLTTFVVGKHSGSSIKELGELHHLSGALSILNLQNVHHARDAREVNLKNKQHLSELVFQCGFDIGNSEKERDVLEQLCPHSKLESLTIEDYGGTKFPNWLEDCYFSNMVSIRLANCKYCSSLPSLGHLPVLKKLYIQGFHFVLRVDREFYGDGSSTTKPFRSLEVLSFTDMPEWQEWFLFEGEHEDGVGVFSTLKELCIIECPKLSGGLPSQLPSLIKLQIAKCQQLVASVPRAPTLNELQLSDCDKVVLKELPPKLDYLFIRGGRIFLQSFAELMTCLAVPGSGVPITLKSLYIEGTFQITTGHCYPSLESLEIRDDSDSLWSFPLESYPKLKSLYVWESKNLESLFVSEESCRDLSSLTRLSIHCSPNFVSFFSGGICAPNLTSISICNCNKVKSLPENMRTLFPSLEYLMVRKCPKLESFPEGGLPLNLVSLYVSYCDKLFSRGLQDLHSLREIIISGGDCKEVESFPEEALLPPTLTDIDISYFPKLKSLKGFQHLASLKNLYIRGCPKLQCLPEEGFPTTLSSLSIYSCPLLKQRYESTCDSAQIRINLNWATQEEALNYLVLVVLKLLKRPNPLFCSTREIASNTTQFYCQI
nr:putative disease resistance rpp13-like protein 1 [Quercus suber]